MLIRSIIILCVGLVTVGAHAKSDIDRWIFKQTGVAKERLLKNVSPTSSTGEKAAKGAIIASPSEEDPDYYYHWIRDAALVADVLISLYEHSTDATERKELMQHLLDFAHFSRKNQLTHSTGLGEPKFYVNGAAFLGPWGRPQNDGPALRASALMRLGRILVAAGYHTYFADRIWPVIRDDLQYVSTEWPKANFDLWEEIKGDHFYTRMVQRRALLEGAEMAVHIDSGFAAWLQTQGELLTLRIEEHFSHESRSIVENINRVEGIWYKYSGLDTATILAMLHTKHYPWLAYSNEYLVNTAHELERAFAGLYHINEARPDLGTAIGRYPEDHYYGGNPWILTTLAFAEYNYELGLENFKAGRKIEAGQYLAQGDLYLERVRNHLDADSSMAEQMRRDNGYMVSARDLTWSYAAWLTATWSRENLTRAMLRVRK